MLSTIQIISQATSCDRWRDLDGGSFHVSSLQVSSFQVSSFQVSSLRVSSLPGNLPNLLEVNAFYLRRASASTKASVNFQRHQL
jgi:hypothetical protein